MVVTSRSAVLRRAASFLSLLAFELAAVVLLTRLGSVPELRIPWHSLTPWLLNSPVEDVLAAILRNIALLIAWWLLGSNLLYLLARLTRVPSAIRAVRWLTLPVVRRATDHALALTLATSLMGGGPAAARAGTSPSRQPPRLRPGRGRAAGAAADPDHLWPAGLRPPVRRQPAPRAAPAHVDLAEQHHRTVVELDHHTAEHPAADQHHRVRAEPGRAAVEHGAAQDHHAPTIHRTGVHRPAHHRATQDHRPTWIHGAAQDHRPAGFHRP